MNIKTSQKVPETAVYLIIWLVIFILPVLVTTSNTGKFDIQILTGWVRMLPFVAIFIINTVWLVPELLFKGKTGYYLLAVVLISFLLVYVWEFTFPILKDLIEGNQLHGIGQRRMPFEMKHPLGPNQPPPGQGQRLPIPNEALLRPRNHFLSIINQVVIAWLVVGFNVAIKVTNKWFTDEQKKRELEKEHLKSELAFLQNQISPHFFMNTLNNIHAQIEFDSKEAQSSIVTLSKMMRYLLYESERGKTILKKEIEFLKSYVDLMKLRLDEGVKVELDISIIDEDIKLHPFLFISFVENAFKHGVSYNEKSYIKIELIQNLEFIEFNCTNSLSVQNKITNPYSGIGLENIRKRLQLLYNDDYYLKTEELKSEYRVLLKIPVNEN